MRHALKTEETLDKSKIESIVKKETHVTLRFIYGADILKTAGENGKIITLKKGETITLPKKLAEKLIKNSLLKFTEIK